LVIVIYWWKFRKLDISGV